MVRKLFRRRWVKALAIALTLVVLPFGALWWLSTSADRELQGEQVKLSSLGYPMTFEERKAYFENKGKNAAPFLDNLAEKYSLLKNYEPLPGEDPAAFLQEFQSLLDDFIEINKFDTYYRSRDYEDRLDIGTSPDSKPRQVMKSALFCAEEACKRQDVLEAIRIFEAADHLSLLTAGRGDVDSYIMGLGDLGSVGGSYMKCATFLRSRQQVLRLLESAESRSALPLPQNAYVLQPGIQARWVEALEAKFYGEYGAEWLDEFEPGSPNREEWWVRRLPHLRKRMISEQLAVWRRFLEKIPNDNEDWRAHRDNFRVSYRVLADQHDMVSRVALRFSSEEEYAAQFYASELLRRAAGIMGIKVVAGLPFDPVLDIFSGEPLKIKHYEEGVVVYGVGPNGTDNNFSEDDIGVAIRYNPVLSKT